MISLRPLLLTLSVFFLKKYLEAVLDNVIKRYFTSDQVFDALYLASCHSFKQFRMYAIIADGTW